MKNLPLIILACTLLASCGGNSSYENKNETVDFVKKEMDSIYKKNKTAISELVSKIDGMLDYVNSNLDSIVKEDTTQGRDIALEFNENHSPISFNAEVIHVGEVDPNVTGNHFKDNDGLLNLLSYSKNGYDSVFATSYYSAAPYTKEMKGYVEHIGKLKYIIIYRTAYKLLPVASSATFEMGADIENGFLFDVASGNLIRQFNLVCVNDQEVYYTTYENDANKTLSSFQSAITANLYSKLNDAMQKAVSDRFTLKGDHRKLRGY